VFALDLLGFGSDKPPLDYTLELWRNYSRFLDGTFRNLLYRQFDWRTAEFDGSSRLSTNSYWCSDQLRRWFKSSSPRTQPTLTARMGTFNRLVRSKLTGQVLFNRVRQKRKFGARSCKSTATRRQLPMNWWISCMLPCDPGAQQVFAVLSAPPGPTIAEVLPNVKCPLLIIWGADDPWTPITGAKIFQQAKSGQRIQIVPIPNAGHCPHDERPDVVNPAILDWLAQL